MSAPAEAARSERNMGTRQRDTIYVLCPPRPAAWVSLQRIVPSIEAGWKAADSPSLAVKFIHDISPASLLAEMRGLTQARAIIVPDGVPPLRDAIRWLRTTWNLSVPFV